MNQEPGYSSKITHFLEVVKIYDDVPTFLESKVLLSADEMGVFTELAC
ncbi:MAG: hypothetical protein WBX22_30160 [Silvibacterium sp.]|jgi:hypothetical protein